MIQGLNIWIKDGGLTHTISIDTDIEGNLPHDIACAIEKVVDLTQVNADMVIEQLVDTYGFPERLKQQDDTENPYYVTWHIPDIVPNAKEPIYVVFEDDGEKPFIINDIIDHNEWEHFVRDKKPQQWCYLNEVLKEGYKL